MTFQNNVRSQAIVHQDDCVSGPVPVEDWSSFDIISLPDQSGAGQRPQAHARSVHARWISVTLQCENISTIWSNSRREIPSSVGQSMQSFNAKRCLCNSHPCLSHIRYSTGEWQFCNNLIFATFYHNIWQKLMFWFNVSVRRPGCLQRSSDGGEWR